MITWGTAAIGKYYRISSVYCTVCKTREEMECDYKTFVERRKAFREEHRTHSAPPEPEDNET